ncbi:hypothetical protein PYS58_17755 [Chryseobacterium indologenes]|uniref:hypothetical protein n=1 Tax=Chryseobacterium TaxID=59732 RepID=UPI00162647FE|nr:MULTISPECIES: hypothetical protein [Chryseobacterium]MDM1553616.1 hypothetical protein [Chryseobacterium indologenes]WET48413.1 hypothetical protein PYS58_17755 [Chryseobacterium indologenes]
MKKSILFILLAAAGKMHSQVGINTANPQGVFHVDGSKDNPATGKPTVLQQANDFVVTPNGSVGIGTITPDVSAMLEINIDGLASGEKKGFLGPKVALASRTDQATIPSPAVGLLVFNLGTGGLDYVGYVFWNGSEWRALDNSTLMPGTIGSLLCNGATLSPSTYTAGVLYNGTMNVPYTAGNGGTYPAQIIGPVNGLTATLSAGSFNAGAGTLSYAITGTPSVSSPTTTSFSLDIGGKTCTATVGAGDGIGLGEMIYYKASLPATPGGVWMSAYVPDLPVLGGKLRLDAYFYASSVAGPQAVTMNPAMVNVSSEPVKFWFSALTNVDRFNAANYVLAPSTPTGSGTSLAPSAYVALDNGIYYNLGYNDMLGITTPRVTGSGGAAHQEVLTMDLSVDDHWYRVYYFPIVDNKNTVDTSDDTREIYLSIQRLY